MGKKGVKKRSAARRNSPSEIPKWETPGTKANCWMVQTPCPGGLMGRTEGVQVGAHRRSRAGRGISNSTTLSGREGEP